MTHNDDDSDTEVRTLSDTLVASTSTSDRFEATFHFEDQFESDDVTADLDEIAAHLCELLEDEYGVTVTHGNVEVSGPRYAASTNIVPPSE